MQPIGGLPCRAMMVRAAALVLAAAALASCGGKSSSPIGNSALASDLGKQVGLSSPLVCWSKAGKLGRESAMGYDRVCGISRAQPSIYVRTGTTDSTGWCVVTPRYVKAPRCPL
jgi:hypothetical protein